MFRFVACTAGIALLTFVLRARELLVPPGDANVGTCYAVARAWLHGSLPYTTVWEYKPPGAFLLCASGLRVFHDASLSASVLGMLAVVVTACAVYGFVLTSEGEGGWPAAAIAASGIVLLSSENAGAYGDAELFVDAAIACGFVVALARRDAWAVVATGCAAAFALQMKLTAIPLAALLVGVVAVRAGAAGALRGAGVAALAVVPFAIEAAVYARAGALETFVDANFAATLRRAAAARLPAGDAGGRWLAQLVLLAPYVEFGPFAPARSRGTRYAALWLLAATAAVVAAREFYPRHFVLLGPPVAVLGALGFCAVARRLRGARRTVAVAAFALVAFGLHAYYPIEQSVLVAYHRAVLRDERWHASDYDALRAALRRIARGGSLYVVQLSPQLYGDLDVPAPTRYVFSGNLFERPMWPMLGFAGRCELERILDRRPRYLATGSLRGLALDPPTAAFVRARIARDYRLMERSGGASIYVLRTRGMAGVANTRTQRR